MIQMIARYDHLSTRRSQCWKLDDSREIGCIESEVCSAAGWVAQEKRK